MPKWNDRGFWFGVGMGVEIGLVLGGLAGLAIAEVIALYL